VGIVTAKLLCTTVIASSSIFSQNAIDEICRDAEHIVAAAQKYKIDPYVLTALIKVESNWNPRVVSISNACGLTQVLDRYSKYTCEELKVPKTSIYEGARLLGYWVNVHKKRNVELGLCGYSQGYACYKEENRARGLTYAKKVVNIATKLQDKGDNLCSRQSCY
jgi:hypothetical protein